MSSEWYAYKAPAGSFGQAGAMQRMGRFQGHIEGDSGTLQVLDVKGQLTMGEQGVLAGGQEAYDDGSGFWLEYNGGTPRFSLGDSTSSKLTWDGSGLNIVGGATLDSGNIGGWDINAASLSQGTGSTTVGLATSGGYAFYAGSATPSSAPFRVTPAGALTATSGSIAGWTMGSTSLSQGSGASTVGLATSGGYAIYAGSATASAAPFRVTPAGAIVATSATITGAITATSGSLGDLTVTGTLTLGSGGKIADADGSYWDQNGLVLVGTTNTDYITFKVSGTNRGFFYGNTNGPVMQADGGESLAVGASLYGGSTGVVANGGIQAYESSYFGYIFPGDVNGPSQTNNKIRATTANELSVTLGDAAGTNSFRIHDSAGQVQFGVTSNGALLVTDADGTALGSYSGRIPIYVNGNLRYLGYYNA